MCTGFSLFLGNNMEERFPEPKLCAQLFTELKLDVRLEECYMKRKPDFSQCMILEQCPCKTQWDIQP